jgi:Flp pilus assembly protein TadD
LGQIGPAIRSYQETVSMNAHLPEAWNNLGVVQQMDGDFEGALESYRKSLKLPGNYAEAHNNLGTLYKLQDMHAPAKECFETAIHHNAKYAPAYTNLCELLEKLNQPQDMLGIVASAKEQFETLPADLRYFEALGIYRQ